MDWILLFLSIFYLSPLGSPDFQTRDRAQARLILPVAILGAEHRDPEVRWRCRRLIDNLPHRLAAAFVYGETASGWCDPELARWWACCPHRLAYLEAYGRLRQQTYRIPEPDYSRGPPDLTQSVLAYANYIRSLATQTPISNGWSWGRCARLSRPGYRDEVTIHAR